VDAYGYYELQRKSFLNVRPLTSLRDIAATDFSDYDGYDDTRGVSSSPPLVSLEPLTAEQRLFVVSQVKGFAVQRKEWCKSTGF
jgi:hypothetical protein